MYPGGTAGTERAKLPLATLFWTHPIGGASFYFQLGNTGMAAAVMDIPGPNSVNRGKKAALARIIKKKKPWEIKCKKPCIKRALIRFYSQGLKD